MDGRQRERAAKLDRRAVARLHAEIIDCADDPHKMSHHSMIDDLREFGVEVTFKQIENALRTLGYKWKEVFLPASNSDRGKKPRQPEAGGWSVFEELDKTTDVHWSAAGPDMQAVLDRIEQLEQALATNGLAEYRGLHRQADEEAHLAKDRAAAMRADMKTVLEQLDRISRRQDILYNIVGSVKLEHDRQKAAAARSLLQDVEDASTQEPQP
jgi:chaperonin cofactor prefoldin